MVSHHTKVLIGQRVAYVRLSGREAPFPTLYGRMYCIFTVNISWGLRDAWCSHTQACLAQWFGRLWMTWIEDHALNTGDRWSRSSACCCFEDSSMMSAVTLLKVHLHSTWISTLLSIDPRPGIWAVSPSSVCCGRSRKIWSDYLGLYSIGGLVRLWPNLEVANNKRPLPI